MGKEATKSFAKLLKWIEESIERGPWLAGPDYSLPDIAATPYMVRLEMLKLSRMWDHKPGVARWWERVKSRPSYETAITKWLRSQDIARYEKLTDPWVEVRRGLDFERTLMETLLAGVRRRMSSPVSRALSTPSPRNTAWRRRSPSASCGPASNRQPIGS